MRCHQQNPNPETGMTVSSSQGCVDAAGRQNERNSARVARISYHNLQKHKMTKGAKKWDRNTMGASQRQGQQAQLKRKGVSDGTGVWYRPSWLSGTIPRVTQPALKAHNKPSQGHSGPPVPDRQLKGQKCSVEETVERIKRQATE